jgi:hypothetical protein
MRRQTKRVIGKSIGVHKKIKSKFVDYNELPEWIKKSEEKINSMSYEEFCDEMIKFGLEAKKVGGVKNLVFRDIQ